MKTAVLIDFDDTIFDSTHFRIGHSQFWLDNCSSETNQKIAESLNEYIKNETPFSPNSAMTPDELRRNQAYVCKFAPQFLFTDTRDFWQNLDQEKFTPLILTFGDRDFQHSKITALKMELPVIFLDHRDKTAEIKSWWRGDHYEINGEKFSDVILIDDRDYSFGDFDKLPRARGFLLDRYEKFDNAKNLSKNLKIVRNFSEIVL